jgi:hypothetical protein
VQVVRARQRAEDLRRENDCLRSGPFGFPASTPRNAPSETSAAKERGGGEGGGTEDAGPASPRPPSTSPVVRFLPRPDDGRPTTPLIRLIPEFDPAHVAGEDGTNADVEAGSWKGNGGAESGWAAPFESESDEQQGDEAEEEEEVEVGEAWGHDEQAIPDQEGEGAQGEFHDQQEQEQEQEQRKSFLREFHQIMAAETSATA